MDKAKQLARIILSLFEDELDDLDGEALILESYYLSKEILEDGNDSAETGTTRPDAQ